jgi:glycosyltransferase involved in cell wall biosynthesis
LDSVGLMLILKNGNETANRYGFNSAIKTLLKGFDVLGINYALDENGTFDTIIANDFFNAEKAIELKKKTGKPLIASIHLSHDIIDEKKLIANSDGIIVYSNMMKKYMHDVYKNLEIPVEVVQLGIDTDIFHTNGISREDFVFFVGRTQSGNKNFLNVMWQALENGIDIKVAGDINNDLPNINVKYLKQDELAKMYQRAKVHILPSTFEPFGLVTLEAMACGCPVIVSTKAGVSELLNDEVSVLFNPEEPFSLPELIDKCRFDSIKISEYAKKFDHTEHAKSFLNAVNTIKGVRCNLNN